MDAQSVMFDARVTHVRELKAQIRRLRDENARLRDENAELSGHLDLAILAAADLADLPAGGRLVIVDGWNRILGADRTARDRGELERQARAHLAEHPADRVWIVLDGPHEAVRTDGRLRVSYTGGTGAHRADRFICDFLRMARFRGELGRIVVETSDRDFRRDVARLSAGYAPVLAAGKGNPL